MKVFLQVVVVMTQCVLLTACRQGMYNQPRFKPEAESDFFKDGASARSLPLHTIERDTALDDATFNSSDPNAALAAKLPIPLTRELIQRGRERYEIFCAVCHGFNGNGNGMIVQRGFPAPPSYHTERLRNVPIGHFYYVITNGYGAMYSYAARVPPEDRWAIAAYIRALQLSHHGAPGDVPPQEQAKLQ